MSQCAAVRFWFAVQFLSPPAFWPAGCRGRRSGPHLPWPPPPPARPPQLLGFTLPLAYGEGPFGLWLGLLPRQVPLDIVVGAPIEVPLFEGARLREAFSSTSACGPPTASQQHCLQCLMYFTRLCQRQLVTSGL